MKLNVSDLLKKWLHYGFEQPIFDLYPEFAQFLLDGPLASQMKVTGDKPFITNNLPAILYQGIPLSYPELIKKFSYKICRVTGEKVLVDNETQEIHTYLGGGQGLVPHNPYKNFFNRPLKKIASEQLSHLKRVAARFGRKGSHILQIVSCVGKRRSQRHVYLRLITADGDLYSFGFNYKKPFNMLYMNHVGLLRSPDIWEYQSRSQKMVTSLLIKDEEKQRLTEYIDRCFGGEKPPVFNLLAQNCALFVKEAVFACCGLKLPTKSLFLTKAFDYMSTQWEKWLKVLFPKRSYFFKPLLKVLHELVRSSVEISLSVILSLVGVTMGAALGIKGRRLSRDDGELKPPAKSIDWWLDLGAKEIHFPGIIQKWQKNQPSTEFHENSLKIAL